MEVFHRVRGERYVNSKDHQNSTMRLFVLKVARTFHSSLASAVAFNVIVMAVVLFTLFSTMAFVDVMAGQSESFPFFLL